MKCHTHLGSRTTGGAFAGFTGAGSTDIALIAVNTFLSAASGALAAMAYTWVRGKRPDVGMTLNGVLAGLVGITAGCDAVHPVGALAIGALAGVLVVIAANTLERRGVDDPVGAVAVHAVGGVWGTLAVALFAASGPSLTQLGIQAAGVGAAFAWTFPLAFGLFKLLDATIGLRIDRDVEHGGLDLHEHGTVAYPEFISFANATAGTFGFTTTSGDGAITEPPVPSVPRSFSTAVPVHRPRPRSRPPLDQPWLAKPPTWGLTLYGQDDGAPPEPYVEL